MMAEQYSVIEEKKYYKTLRDGHIESIGLLNPYLDPNVHIEINEQEYKEIESAMKQRPELRDGYMSLLKAATLEWEYVELPPLQDPEESNIDFIMEYLAEQEERICLLELFGGANDL